MSSGVRQVRARRAVRRQGRSVPTHRRGRRQFCWRSTAATCAARTHCRSCLAACVRACARAASISAASISAARQGARCRRAARTAWPRRCGRRSICYAHCNGARGAASAQRLGYLDAGRRRVGVLCTSAAMPRSHPIRHDTTGNAENARCSNTHYWSHCGAFACCTADQHSRSRDVRECRAVAGLTWKADLRCRVSTSSAIVPQSSAR